MNRNLDRIFLRFSAEKLNQFSSRIIDCLGRLSYEQIWWRGSKNENAAGNLVLHLCGNVRQWIGAGVAGKADIRAREEEFRAAGGPGAEELAGRLRAAVAEALAVLDGLTAESLGRRITVQGYQVTVLEAVYHVVEHFAQHTGQILFATKQFTHQDLGYYRHLAGGSAHQREIP